METEPDCPAPGQIRQRTLPWCGSPSSLAMEGGAARGAGGDPEPSLIIYWLQRRHPRGESGSFRGGDIPRAGTGPERRAPPDARRGLAMTTQCEVALREACFCPGEGAQWSRETDEQGALMRSLQMVAPEETAPDEGCGSIACVRAAVTVEFNPRKKGRVRRCSPLLLSRAAGVRTTRPKARERCALERRRELARRGRHRCDDPGRFGGCNT